MPDNIKIADNLRCICGVLDTIDVKLTELLEEEETNGNETSTHEAC